AIGIKDIDKTVAQPRLIVMLISLLERIGDKEVASNVLNTKRRKTRAAQGRGRELRVAKTSELNLIEVLVKNVYGAQVKIGGVQEGALSVCAQGQAFVDRIGRRVIHGENGIVRIEIGAPGRERAVLGCEDKAAWIQRLIGTNLKTGCGED